MRNFENLQQLAALAGQPVATSDWTTVTQEQINQFAQATGDHQWIHVDPVRAQAGPFGAPIAHGFLTLSLLPNFFESAYANAQTRMGINYGLNKVRFTSPVPVDSRLRGHLHLLACEDIEPKGIQMTWKVTVEREGSDKPVCVAESVVRHYA
jgi:acyl dehydratase